MIIDPESFVPVEVDRRLAASRVVRPAVEASSRPRRRPRRGVVLRVAAWATGRTALV